MLYHITRVLSRVAGALVWRWTVEGAKHVPRRGGVILASNHQSYLDVLLLGAACPRKIRYVARDTLWKNPAMAWLITDWGAIPIERDRPGKDRLLGLIEVAGSGQVLALFPEGGRTRSGEVGEMRGGVGFIARRAGVPVVPVAIRGAWKAWPAGSSFPRRGRVRISFGRAVMYDESWEDRDVAADIRRRVLALLDGPDVPRPGPSGDEAACAPRTGEGAA